MSQATVSRPSKATYLRRRVMVFGTLFLALAAVASMFTSQAQANSVAGSGASVVGSADFQYITIQSGDSLWSLASKYADNQDPREWVAALVSLNALESSTLQPGQKLALPTLR